MQLSYTEEDIPELVFAIVLFKNEFRLSVKTDRYYKLVLKYSGEMQFYIDEKLTMCFDEDIALAKSIRTFFDEGSITKYDPTLSNIKDIMINKFMDLIWISATSDKPIKARL